MEMGCIRQLHWEPALEALQNEPQRILGQTLVSLGNLIFPPVVLARPSARRAEAQPRANSHTRLMSHILHPALPAPSAAARAAPVLGGNQMG